MSDGINILFGKGPFGKLRDREILAVCSFALKGQNMKAQDNALGKWPNKIPSPERARGVVA